jgi:hypothetical protein
MSCSDKNATSCSRQSYVSIRRHTSAYISCSDKNATSCSRKSYVSIRQRTSAYVSIRQLKRQRQKRHVMLQTAIRRHTFAYVGIRQHTSAEATKTPRLALDSNLRSSRAHWLVDLQVKKKKKLRTGLTPSQVVRYSPALNCTHIICIQG